MLDLYSPRCTDYPCNCKVQCTLTRPPPLASLTISTLITGRSISQHKLLSWVSDQYIYFPPKIMNLTFNVHQTILLPSNSPLLLQYFSSQWMPAVKDPQETRDKFRCSNRTCGISAGVVWEGKQGRWAWVRWLWRLFTKAGVALDWVYRAVFVLVCMYSCHVTSSSLSQLAEWINKYVH